MTDIEFVKALPPIEKGSVIIVRMSKPLADTARILLDGLEQHFGHRDFLVVVLGPREDMDVIPAQEVAGWVEGRRGYFGSHGSQYLDDRLP